MATGDTRGAVDKDKYHATEGPCYAEKANTVAWSGLFLVANDSGDGDVEEEESGYELSDESSVERPELNLSEVEKWCWRWVNIVFSTMMMRLVTFFTHFFRHF
ncbi:hypothetical protein KIW84_050042 [Lathyrus oleraceus]|uniref:Uncharacterized protein n=1 Tax=Pisum sativum TaxID=3888 RepID=A0A9D4WKK8_PEA|nr:hypothetical protein KIW84_050042 [Pisum sativum]